MDHTRMKLTYELNPATNSCVIWPVGTDGKTDYSKEVCSTAYDNEEDARRVVACWNYLIPFTTEQLEQKTADLYELMQMRDEVLEKECAQLKEDSQKLIRDHNKLLLDNIKLIQERDEALEALRAVMFKRSVAQRIESRAKAVEVLAKHDKQ